MANIARQSGLFCKNRVDILPFQKYLPFSSYELLHKIQLIHNQGFIPSITRGDPGVGDTLEHALGISRNNAKTPDYKGIELKAARLSRDGAARHSIKSTLFTRPILRPFGILTHVETVVLLSKV